MLTETELAFEIGMMGAGKARTFLTTMLARMGGVVVASKPTEPPIHESSAAEDAATDEQANREFHTPDPASQESKAVNYIMTHPNCLSGEVKRAIGASDNQWSYTLRKLRNSKQVHSEGELRNMRWVPN